MKSCIDLKATYGKKFKVCLEESYPAQPAGRRDASDALWLQIIPGRLGHVFPHGGDLLAASTNSRGVTAQRLLALPDVTLWQNGSDGVTVLFPPDRLEDVAALLHLRRRRRVSDKERDRLRALGVKYGFNYGTGARPASAVCVAGTQGDPEHPQAPATQNQGLVDAVMAGAPTY